MLPRHSFCFQCLQFLVFVCKHTYETLCLMYLCHQKPNPSSLLSDVIYECSLILFSEPNSLAYLPNMQRHKENDATSQRHLVVMWSAPRNFYLHENTLSVGLTVGPPWANGKDLFNLMYFGQAKNTFHNRSYHRTLS